MQIKNLFEEDDAVSPVIGVILMVAITVILAAVIASFVLGLGDTAGEAQPTSSIDFEYSDSDSNLTVTVSDGESISGQNLYIRGEMNSTDGSNNAVVDVDTTFESATSTGFSNTNGGFNASGVGGYGGSGEISASQGIEISNNGGSGTTDTGVTPYDINIVWDNGDGDSATLNSDSNE